MKNFYIILILFFSFAIFSCAKKSDTSSTNTEIEGTWQTPCYVSGSYYYIKKVTVSGTNWTDTIESHTDSSCATEYDLWLRTFGSLSISGAQFTMTLSENTYTPQTSGGVSWSNTNSYCGLTGWEINTAQSAAGKTCGGTAINASGTAYYGLYLLDGSKLFWTLSSDAYNDSVPTGDNDTFTKQ